MTRIKPILWSIALAGAVLPALAATSEHYPISTSDVAAAISASGMAVAPEQITFLTEVVATRPAPALKVRSVERIGSERLSARMECIESDQCLPFFVAIRTDGQNTKQSAAISAMISRAGIAPRAAAVVRAGATVNLFLDGQHVHIRIPVKCLESGAPGQAIRVQSIRVDDKSDRLVYTAQVVDGLTVRGRLQ
jgi:hypothetical protein